ncbi:MAG: Ribosomal RNA small subunit methyltransferase I [Firmicutes bacterium ADurb.Bin193]|nr:MAG: Ribosomal RNA small subunit methyltransferase I [Firmicutes bacterium ADurb.Bin193]
MAGKLFIVGTPIGNMDDITIRALEALKNADLIAAEDTRRTGILLNRFNIKVPLTSYYEHKKREKGEYVIKKLKEGKNVALVSDAGMPAISDPGEDLVKLCIENGIEFTVIPGPTAFVTALVASGLPTSNFCFEGFLTVKKTGRLARLEEIKNDKRTLVFYEAPHKLDRTLKDILAVLGDRRAAACRELTKKHEEVIRGTVSSLITHFSETGPKGEFVLVVEGLVKEEEKEFSMTVSEHIDMLISEGMDKKEAVKTAAKQRNLPKREVYNAYVGEGGED